tara:strand:- start:364 stop:537 length:174 start_codon:yes stop_codon:yes gene_type:complete
MKTINPTKNINPNENDKSNNIKELRPRITKRLLEKYYPKGFYNIQMMKNRKDQKIVA